MVVKSKVARERERNSTFTVRDAKVVARATARHKGLGLTQSNYVCRLIVEDLNDLLGSEVPAPLSKWGDVLFADRAGTWSVCYVNEDVRGFAGRRAAQLEMDVSGYLMTLIARDVARDGPLVLRESPLAYLPAWGRPAGVDALMARAILRAAGLKRR